MTLNELKKLHEKATQAAEKATADFLGAYKQENPNCPYGEPMYPCGFAWVDIFVDLRSKQGKLMKEAGFEKRMFGRGFQVYNPSGHRGQNMNAKLHGACAYADVMRDNGFNAIVYDRLD